MMTKTQQIELFNKIQSEPRAVLRKFELTCNFRAIIAPYLTKQSDYHIDMTADELAAIIRKELGI